MRTARLVAVPILLAFLVSAHADKPRSDLHGDSLPEGVLARLGTVRLRPGGPPFSAAIAPDGKTLATAEWGTLRFWDLATGKETRSVPIPSGLGIGHVAYSPDGKYCLVHADRMGPFFPHVVDTEVVYLVETATGKAREIRQDYVRYAEPHFLPNG